MTTNQTALKALERALPIVTDWEREREERYGIGWAGERQSARSQLKNAIGEIKASVGNPCCDNEECDALAEWEDGFGPPPCPTCDSGQTYPLGKLGSLPWFRCRSCGIDFY